MAISNNFSDEITESAGYKWLNCIYFGGGGGEFLGESGSWVFVEKN